MLVGFYSNDVRDKYDSTWKGEINNVLYDDVGHLGIYKANVPNIKDIRLVPIDKDVASKIINIIFPSKKHLWQPQNLVITAVMNNEEFDGVEDGDLFICSTDPQIFTELQQVLKYAPEGTLCRKWDKDTLDALHFTLMYFLNTFLQKTGAYNPPEQTKSTLVM